MKRKNPTPQLVVGFFLFINKIEKFLFELDLLAFSQFVAPSGSPIVLQ
jgi:hypothetical protein